jgi:hypothetical protein
VVLHSEQGPCVKIFIVAYMRDWKDLKAEIASLCRLGWERYVRFQVATPDQDRDDLTSEVIQALKRDAAENCKVFVQGKSVFTRRLIAAEYDTQLAPSVATLLKKIKIALKDCQLEWKTYAEAEWHKSSIRHASIERWYQQFAMHGQGEVAKNLLKGLRVITLGELRDAFKRHGLEGDGVGTRCLHAYVVDDEPGASSNAICDVLSKLWNPGDVRSLNLGNPQFFEGLDIDLLYVYEDGLWSGVELVNRLAQLSQLPTFMSSKVRVEFRYCAVADAGLAAGRIAASNYPAGKFTVVSAQEHFDFIHPDTNNTFSHLADRSDESVRKAIDASIQPYIFSRKGLWGNAYPAAMELCGDIGAQLIKPFLQSQALKKAHLAAIVEGREPSDIEREIPEVEPEKVSKWKLGAEGYGSTVVFESSVPKPVLPLMWLSGPVMIEGEEVEWLPLFWDSRRIGVAAPRI